MSEATKVKATPKATKSTKTAKAKLAIVPHVSEVSRTDHELGRMRYHEALAYAMYKIAEGEQCDTLDQLALVTDGLTKVAQSTVAKSGILDTLRQSGLPHTHLFAPMKSKKDKIPNPNSTCPNQEFYDTMITAATLGLPVEARKMLQLEKNNEQFTQSADRKDYGQTAQAKLLFTTANRYYWQQQPASVLKDVRNQLQKANATGTEPARKGTDRARLIKAAEEGIKIVKQILAKEDMGGQDKEPVETLMAAWDTIKASCESLKDVPNS